MKKIISLFLINCIFFISLDLPGYAIAPFKNNNTLVAMVNSKQSKPAIINFNEFTICPSKNKGIDVLNQKHLKDFNTEVEEVMQKENISRDEAIKKIEIPLKINPYLYTGPNGKTYFLKNMGLNNNFVGETEQLHIINIIKEYLAYEIYGLFMTVPDHYIVKNKKKFYIASELKDKYESFDDFCKGSYSEIMKQHTKNGIPIKGLFENILVPIFLGDTDFFGKNFDNLGVIPIYEDENSDKIKEYQIVKIDPGRSCLLNTFLGNLELHLNLYLNLPSKNAEEKYKKVTNYIGVRFYDIFYYQIKYKNKISNIKKIAELDPNKLKKIIFNKNIPDNYFPKDIRRAFLLSLLHKQEVFKKALNENYNCNLTQNLVDLNEQKKLETSELYSYIKQWECPVGDITNRLPTTEETFSIGPILSYNNNNISARIDNSKNASYYEHKLLTSSPMPSWIFFENRKSLFLDSQRYYKNTNPFFNQKNISTRPLIKKNEVKNGWKFYISIDRNKKGNMNKAMQLLTPILFDPANDINSFKILRENREKNPRQLIKGKDIVIHGLSSTNKPKDWIRIFNKIETRLRNSGITPGEVPLCSIPLFEQDKPFIYYRNPYKITNDFGYYKSVAKIIESTESENLKECRKNVEQYKKYYNASDLKDTFQNISIEKTKEILWEILLFSGEENIANISSLCCNPKKIKLQESYNLLKKILTSNPSINTNGIDDPIEIIKLIAENKKNLNLPELPDLVSKTIQTLYFLINKNSNLKDYDIIILTKLLNSSDYKKYWKYIYELIIKKITPILEAENHLQSLVELMETNTYPQEDWSLLIDIFLSRIKTINTFNSNKINIFKELIENKNNLLNLIRNRKTDKNNLAQLVKKTRVSNNDIETIINFFKTSKINKENSSDNLYDIFENLAQNIHLNTSNIIHIFSIIEKLLEKKGSNEKEIIYLLKSFILKLIKQTHHSNNINTYINIIITMLTNEKINLDIKNGTYTNICSILLDIASKVQFNQDNISKLIDMLNNKNINIDIKKEICSILLDIASKFQFNQDNISKLINIMLIKNQFQEIKIQKNIFNNKNIFGILYEIIKKDKNEQRNSFTPEHINSLIEILTTPDIFINKEYKAKPFCSLLERIAFNDRFNKQEYAFNNKNIKKLIDVMINKDVIPIIKGNGVDILTVKKRTFTTFRKNPSVCSVLYTLANEKFFHFGDEDIITLIKTLQNLNNDNVKNTFCNVLKKIAQNGKINDEHYKSLTSLWQNNKLNKSIQAILDAADKANEKLESNV